jgi:tRNA-dihydrouridine synthase
MITVHGRTRTQGFSGSASLEQIAAVRAAVPRHVPVIGNGDVVEVAGYRRMKDATGCDGVMIGRGAMGNPWLFRRLGELERGRPDPGEPSPAERLAIFERHVALLRELRAGPKLYHELRKAGCWYAKGLPGANALRIALFDLRDDAAVVARATAFFVAHTARSPRADVRADARLVVAA